VKLQVAGLQLGSVVLEAEYADAGRPSFFEAGLLLRISVNVTANFGNVTDSARLGVARSRL
jgi:hypothetical protein